MGLRVVQEKKYNVIVIGAGIAGLVCAAFLSKKGARVLVLEQHERPGGCCSSFEKDGFKFDVGSHIFGGCGSRGLLGRILNELEISVDFVKRFPADRIIFPDEIVDIPPDLEEYERLLQKKFPEEKVSIKQFFEEIVKLFRKSLSWQIPNEQKGASFQDLVDVFFKSEKLKAIVSGLYGYLGEAPSKISAVSLASLLVVFIRDGTYYPKGGAQSLPDALVQGIQKNGGNVYLSTSASQIVFQNGSIKGVETKEGNFFETDIVVSNIDADFTFGSLLKNYDGKIKQKISKFKKSMSLFVMYIGLAAFEEKMHYKKGMYHSSYSLNNKENNSYYIHIPTCYDRSLAPPGKSIIIPQYIFPYEYESINDWKACKEKLQSWMLNELNKIFPGIHDSIVVCESATPLTIQRYTGNSNGSVYGWALTPDKVFEGRLMNETEINGLYLAGHWTNPGAGVPSVAASGWYVANQIWNRYSNLFLSISKN